MGFGNVPFEVTSPLFGAVYSMPFELRMLIVGAAILAGIFWWVRKQGDDSSERGIDD